MSSTTEDRREPPLQDSDVDAIRARFNDVAAADGRPMTKIAVETGISYTTLQAWRTATYRGDNLRVAKQAHAWMVTREARTKTRMTMRAEPTFLMTQTASRIWELLEFAQSLPDMVLITGGAGVGKTTSIRQYATQSANVWIATAEPAHRSITSFMDLLCETLGTEEEFRAAAMSRVIRRRLLNTQGLLIIDEAQHLSAQIRDQIRTTVHDMAGIGVALVGNEVMNKVFRAERADLKFAQLTRRIGQRLNRDRPYRRDVEMLLDGWGLDAPDAREVAMGIAMKPGANGQMTKTLRMAFAMADMRGDETPTAADITDCYRQLGGDA